MVFRPRSNWGQSTSGWTLIFYLEGNFSLPIRVVWCEQPGFLIISILPCIPIKKREMEWGGSCRGKAVLTLTNLPWGAWEDWWSAFWQLVVPWIKFLFRLFWLESFAALSVPWWFSALPQEGLWFLCNFYLILWMYAVRFDTYIVLRIADV